MIDVLLQYILGPLIGALGVKYLGARRWGRVKARASKVLADPQNPITSPKEAIEAAIVDEHYDEIGKTVDRLLADEAKGKLRIAASVEAARSASAGVVDTTIVPRDGSEEFKPAWPIK